MIVLAYAALGLGGVLLAARVWPEGRALERLTLAALLVPALSVGTVVVLGWLHAIAPWPYALALAVVLGGSLAIGGRPAWARITTDAAAARTVLAAMGREPVLLAPVLVAVVPVVLAVVAAALCVPWAWDALGYHLPIVHDALATGTLRDVPTTVAYVNSYPHFVDLSFVAFRLALDGPTLIELGQLPFLPAGVLGVSLLMSRAGVETHRALALALPFAAVPVVMLQLATNYVDVAVASLALAAFALAGSQDRVGWASAGLAFGMLLGSKPSAPPITALGLGLVLFRAHRAGGLRWGALAAALALAIGSPTYVRNLIEHGSPLWPVELRLGPVVFPGEVTVAELSRQGLIEPYRSMGWLGRLASSWAEIFPERPIYDMRIGGLGPVMPLLFLALPVLAFLLRRAERRRAILDALVPVLVCALGTLASPAAYWSRYTLALPGALLVTYAVVLELAPRLRAPGVALLSAVSALAVAITVPGLTASGPSLLEMLEMMPEERMAAVAVDAQELDWEAARESVGPGESFGYDPCFGMPGRIVRADATSRISYFDRGHAELSELDAWIRRERVRVVALGSSWHALLARAHPERFRERFRSRYPDWQPCVVFDVLGD